MAMVLYTQADFFLQLESRGCHKAADGPDGYTYWLDENGEPFSVPPPEESAKGFFRYPDWMLDDLIREVGLPAKPKKGH